MTWFAFRMSGFGGRYVAERIVSSGPGWYATGSPAWSVIRFEGTDGKAFRTEDECRAWCKEQNQQQGRR